MKDEKIVLCGANAYNQKYYFNEEFDSLPESVKKELQIMCVWFVQEVGGVLALEFDEDGNLELRTEAHEYDGSIDEIGSYLKIKQIREERRSCWNPWSSISGCFYLGMDPEEAGEDRGE